MPIHKEGSGEQWGNHGKVYHGPDAKEKAEKQAAAAHANGFRGDGAEGADSEGSPTRMNELDVAKAMQAGELPSPQRVGNQFLFNVRITGTGISHRSGLGPNHDESEYVYRTPEHFLSPEFLERCVGLQLTFEHPTDKPFLDTESFRDRNLGVVILPYVLGDEVWGIGRTFDEDAAVLMGTTHISTSPAIGFDEESIETITLESGEILRIEGRPSYVDHLAVVPNGVWDKGGDPVGIDTGDGPMTVKDAEEQARKDAEEATRKEEEERDDAARKDAGETDEEREARKDKARKNAEEKARANATPPAWADALVKRIDALENKGGDVETAADRARKDAEDKESKESEARKDAEARADAAEKAAASDRAKILDLEAKYRALTKERDPADAAAIAQCQARADSLGRALNINHIEIKPADGEGPIAYRRRMAAKFQRFARSDEAKNADVRRADSSVLPLLEQVIYADAQAAANDPGAVAGPGQLYYEKREMLGRVVEIPHGDSGVFIRNHGASGYRQRGGVNTQVGK